MFQHKLFVDDVIFYILASLPNENFPTSDINILFYKLKQKYPKCFENLIFHMGCQPCSEHLCNMVTRAYICNLFGYNNTFTKENKMSFINHIEERFAPLQKENVNEIINYIKTEKLI